jgi:hypothetical protein
MLQGARAMERPAWFGCKTSIVLCGALKMIGTLGKYFGLSDFEKR